MDIKFYNSRLIPQWAHIEYTWKIERFWELRALASIEGTLEMCIIMIYIKNKKIYV
jgi:hypothetical protein